MNGKAYTRPEFIKEYAPFIERVTKGTGIFTGTMVSQAIVESSGYVGGKFLVGGSKLSREAHNLFGIKANSNWTGKTYNIDTGEVDRFGNKYIEKNAGFRYYNSYKDSIRDYVDFLKSNQRYEKAGVFKAKNVKEQAKSLKLGGYATSPNYADTLSQIYETVRGDIYQSLTDSRKRQNKYFIALGLIAVAGIVYLFKQKK